MLFLINEDHDLNIVHLCIELVFLAKSDMISQSTGTLSCSTIRVMEFPEKDINPSPLTHGILTDSGALSECSYVEEEYLSPQRLVSHLNICTYTEATYLLSTKQSFVILYIVARSYWYRGPQSVGISGDEG